MEGVDGEIQRAILDMILSYSTAVFRVAITTDYDVQSIINSSYNPFTIIKASCMTSNFYFSYFSPFIFLLFMMIS